jgi:hypothetical protein
MTVGIELNFNSLAHGASSSIDRHAGREWLQPPGLRKWRGRDPLEWHQKRQGLPSAANSRL